MIISSTNGDVIVDGRGGFYMNHRMISDDYPDGVVFSPLNTPPNETFADIIGLRGDDVPWTITGCTFCGNLRGRYGMTIAALKYIWRQK